MSEGIVAVAMLLLIGGIGCLAMVILSLPYGYGLSAAFLIAATIGYISWGEGGKTE